MVDLTLHHDFPPSEEYARRFEREDVLARVKVLDARAQRKGLASLDPARNKLIEIGMEISPRGAVTKNNYGVLHLGWKAQADEDWPDRVMREVDEIRERIRRSHGTKLRFVIWAGMGGSAEDKAMYNAVGLLKSSPRLYVLDSTDPAKLQAILDDMEKRSRSVVEALRSTLVVGMAMGMTSYEPVVNLEKLHVLYQRHKIDARPNFIYMTLPGSLLDRFGRERGLRRVELQLDGGNSTAGRHSGPLTRGSLYPLGLAGVQLDGWVSGTFLDRKQIQEAFDLAAFLHAQGLARRDKVTLLLPPSWEGVAIWTKQDFEESLGKSEALGIKILVNEKPLLANYRSPKDPQQDRVFFAVVRKGEDGDYRKKVDVLRRAGYPLAILHLPARIPLSTYMQWIHYVVFGLGFLREMNFVTQPSVELYKAITNRLYDEAKKAGGIQKTDAWKRFWDADTTIRYRGGIALHFGFFERPAASTGPAAWVELLRRSQRCGAEYLELTHFGDLRYSDRGKALRRVLERAADKVLRSRWKMPVDVYEGPAMNHSYHEMIIGHGSCFSTVFLTEDYASIPEADYTADYHLAQFLATQMALAERHRPVVAVTLRDRRASTLAALDEFFRQIGNLVRQTRRAGTGNA